MNNQEGNPQEINQIMMQFGPLHGNVEKQEIHTPPAPMPQQQDAKASEEKEYQSPVYLAKRKGNKIDIIRIANAIYELGMVEDEKGRRLMKKDYMIAFGRTFNIDLSDYDKDLSNSMSSSVAYEKQTRIFDDMKQKHQEIYNGK